MVKKFNSIEEIQKYYNKETNTYIFKENDEYIDLVKFNFDLELSSNIDCKDIIAQDIDASDINACDIYAYDINARDIYAWSISAFDISYYAVCFVYDSIKCKSIKGRRANAKHFVLDGKIEIKED